jgi:hypothetical protein
LHAFRKLSAALLPEHDCHAELRKQLLSEKGFEKLLPQLTCCSIAWDWTYRGVTAEAMNREISSMIECAALNRENRTRSLAIIETSLLHTAKTFVAQAKAALMVQSSGSSVKNGCSLLGYDLPKPSFLPAESEAKEVLMGLLPSLSHVISYHKSAVVNAKAIASFEGSPMLSFASCPDSWQNPQLFSIDPYGNDFICKICSDELSNIYMHCDGCENILSKDFNICAR